MTDLFSTAVPNADDPAVPNGREPGSIAINRTPIRLDEQSPGPEHCDEHDRCWVFMPDLGTWASWRLITVSHINQYHSHWLPFDALPAPAAR